MELDLGQWIVIIFCAILLLSYIRGYYYNRQLAERVSVWLIEGLKGWGVVEPGEKMPGMVSGGRLQVEPAGPPLRKIEALYVLAPRENPLFWVAHRLQGRGDELYLWISFVHKPEQDVELAQPGDRQFTGRLKAQDKPALTMVEGVGRLQMAVEQKEGALTEGRVRAYVGGNPALFKRLALRANKPHLFLRANLRGVLAQPAAEFFNALSEMAKKN